MAEGPGVAHLRDPDSATRALGHLPAKVFVAIRRKNTMVDMARDRAARGKRLSPDDIYDDMVKRLQAKKNFERKWDKPSGSPTTIKSVFPWDHCGLQVVDY